MIPTGMIGFGGVPIYSSVLALERRPKHAHAEKRWHAGRAYHRRIQKKWNRRYGYDSVPGAYHTPFGLVCHPEIVKQLREQVGLHPVPEGMRA